METNKNKILIAIPTNRLIQPKMMMSLIDMVKETKENVDVILADKGYTIAENRNYAVIQAIKGEYTHLMMIDDDMIFPADTLDKMLEHDKEFVGVSANSKTLPTMAVVTTFDQEEMSVADRLLGRQNLPKELFKCKAVGGSVTLMKVSMFEKLGRPLFSNEVEKNGLNKLGEDYWFCRECERAGVDIWVDPTIPIGHIGNYIY